MGINDSIFDDFGSKGDWDFKISSSDLDMMTDMSFHLTSDHLERGTEYLQKGDYKEAASHFAYGANKRNNTRCAMMLGAMLMDGLVKQGEYRSWSTWEPSTEEYIKRAAEEEIPQGMYLYAVLFSLGKAKDITEKEAFKLIEKAAKAGHAEAREIYDEEKKRRKKSWGFGFLKGTIDTSSEAIGDSIADKITKGLTNLFDL